MSALAKLASRTMANDYASAVNHSIVVNPVSVATKLREVHAAIGVLENVLIDSDQSYSFASALKDIADKLEDGHLDLAATVGVTTSNVEQATGRNRKTAEQLAMVIHRTIQRAYEEEGEASLSIVGSPHNTRVMVLRV